MLLHPLCQHRWSLTDALQTQPQVGIELELRLAKFAVPVCACVSHPLGYVSHWRAELVVFSRQFSSVVISRHSMFDWRLSSDWLALWRSPDRC